MPLQMPQANSAPFITRQYFPKSQVFLGVFFLPPWSHRNLKVTPVGSSPSSRVSSVGVAGIRHDGMAAKAMIATEPLSTRAAAFRLEILWVTRFLAKQHAKCPQLRSGRILGHGVWQSAKDQIVLKSDDVDAFDRKHARSVRSSVCFHHHAPRHAYACASERSVARRRPNAKESVMA